MSLQPDPYGLTPGDIPTDELPRLVRSAQLVHPELPPGIPATGTDATGVEPYTPDYYGPSVSPGGGAAGDAGGGGDGSSGDGCCD